MIITDYYLFEKLPTSKSATRFDCTASTASHPEFEAMRARARGNQLFIHFTDVPAQFGGDVHRKADKALSNQKNISSLFVPDVTLPLCYGDCKNTSDALLLRFEPSFATPLRFEVFVCRGQRNNRRNLYNLFVDGELDTEIKAIKAKING